MRDPDIRTIGHAGLDGQYPPNSLAGIRAAARSLDMVEVDVRQCGSGEVVLFHDADLTPTTDYEGRVSETSWETLRRLSIHGTDEHVVKLRESIEMVPSSVGFNVELKETGLAPPVAALLEGVDNRVLVSSFIPEALAEVEDHDLGLETALLFEGDVDTSLERAVELGCTHVHPHCELCVETNVVERAQRAGLAVNAWTVRDAGMAGVLDEMGVDGLILDRTGLV